MQLQLDVTFPVKYPLPHHAYHAPGKVFDLDRAEGCLGACTGECRNGSPCPFLGAGEDSSLTEIDEHGEVTLH